MFQFNFNATENDERRGDDLNGRFDFFGGATVNNYFNYVYLSFLNAQEKN